MYYPNNGVVWEAFTHARVSSIPSKGYAANAYFFPSLFKQLSCN